MEVRILTNEERARWLGRGSYDEEAQTVLITSSSIPSGFEWVGASIKIERPSDAKVVARGIVISKEGSTIQLEISSK